jgi:hypothetical protein
MRQLSELVSFSSSVQDGNVVNIFIGNGVDVETVRRITDEFVNQQLRIDTAVFAELDTYSNQIGQLDSTIANANTGLTSALDSFFSSLGAVADSPTSIPARQLVLSEAERLAQRFNTLQQNISNQASNINSQISSIASDIDQLATSIAKLKMTPTTYLTSAKRRCVSCQSWSRLVHRCRMAMSSIFLLVAGSRWCWVRHQTVWYRLMTLCSPAGQSWPLK